MNGLKIFHIMKERMGWLGQRQRVLAQNVANADTPYYEAHDVKPLDFRKVLQNRSSQQGSMHVAKTNDAHLHGGGDRNVYKTGAVRNAYEVTPTGNSVTVEEQMLKISETADQYRLTSELYKKYTKMFKMAAGTPN